VVGTVKHGEKLDVVQTRRRFVRVRTRSGAMGWTDSRQLLSTDEMDDLRELAEEAGKLPSQGEASVYDALNMHTEPNRGSPSFAQIPENGSVAVVGHRLVPRLPGTTRQTSIVTPAPPKSIRKKKQKESSRIPPPPMPAAPPLPANWLELSKSALPQSRSEEEFAKEAAAGTAREKEEPAEKPIPLEDWSLVRMKDGRTGWVLARMLVMAIPDEVAQYAEGHRITSYFALADIKDGDQMKHHWLWTTIESGREPYEFDGLRVFIWNVRRHRYETAYIERKLRGYYPVVATKGAERGEGATFSVIVDSGGQTVRKTYVFNGTRVNLQRKEPFTRDPGQSVPQTAGAAPPGQPAPPDPGFLDNLKSRAKSVLK